MKQNKLVIILIIIIIVLAGYIIYDKLLTNTSDNVEEEEEITLVDSISLDYVNVYLLSDSSIYLEPLSIAEINNLDSNDLLKERLTTLYNRAFYYDVYIGNSQLKGFKITLSSEITKMVQVTYNDYIYIIFIKDDNTVALFNYDEYYNLLYTTVYDNYNDYENVEDIIDNEIIYLDGSKEELSFD